MSCNIKGSISTDVTDENGKFTFPSLTNQNAVLVFTILGYNTIEYPLALYKKDTFFILSKNISLKEVVVSAEKKSILNPESQETILDFDLLNDHLLVLTAGINKNNIRLIDETGKIIASLKVNKNTENLKHDCLGNLQLFSNDSVWQVFYDYEKLNELSPFPTNLYERIIGYCVCSNNKTYYFQNMKYRNLRTNFFYYCEAERGVRYELAEFQDSAKIRSFELDYNLQYFLNERRITKHMMYNEPVDIIKKNIDQYREALPLDWAYIKWLGKVNTQLIKVDTTLFLADFTDSVIYSISRNNELKFSSKFYALKNNNITSCIYIDGDYKETYLIQFFNGKLTAVKFDINTGKELSKTEISDIPYLPKKLIINSGKIYFVQKNLADQQPYKILKYDIN